jgi:hypothetical protein
VSPVSLWLSVCLSVCPSAGWLLLLVLPCACVCWWVSPCCFVVYACGWSLSVCVCVCLLPSWLAGQLVAIFFYLIGIKVIGSWLRAGAGFFCWGCVVVFCLFVVVCCCVCACAVLFASCVSVSVCLSCFWSCLEPVCACLPCGSDF